MILLIINADSFVQRKLMIKIFSIRQIAEKYVGLLRISTAVCLITGFEYSYCSLSRETPHNI
jgi:hypothetical protein